MPDPNTYTLTLRHAKPRALNPMLIRRRVEKLERFTAPTLERLLKRVERYAWGRLSKDEQKLLVDGDPPSSVMERHRGLVSATLTKVDDKCWIA